MPKLSDREKLADLEGRQNKLAEDIENARRKVRGKYAAILAELGVERLSEREFRDIMSFAIKAGGASSVAALKVLPPTTGHS